MKWQLNTYLLFVSWVESILIILLSSSSFMKSSFLIQMIRWIRGSSRIEFFIFLIAWGIFFEWWELDIQFLPYSSSPLMIQAESNHFILAYILRMNVSHDFGRPFEVAITTSAFFTSYFTSSICFLGSYSDVYYFIQIAWSRNQTSISVSLGKTLVV